MSYAGLCGSRDIQPDRDNFFHPVSLNVMRSFVRKQQRLFPHCGFVHSISLDRSNPEITLPAPRQMKLIICEIPVGNYFQLKGEASENATWFQWEDIHPGAASFLDANVPRFRT
jgi:hypothetical protein